MNIGIWIAEKKYTFKIEIGWFKGNDFKLFELTLFHKWDDSDLCIIQLQIAKVVFGLFLVG